MKEKIAKSKARAEKTTAGMSNVILNATLMNNPNVCKKKEKKKKKNIHFSFSFLSNAILSTAKTRNIIPSMQGMCVLIFFDTEFSLLFREIQYFSKGDNRAIESSSISNPPLDIVLGYVYSYLDEKNKNK